jgi:hypothetical protein
MCYMYAFVHRKGYTATNGIRIPTGCNLYNVLGRFYMLLLV